MTTQTASSPDDAKKIVVSDGSQKAVGKMSVEGEPKLSAESSSSGMVEYGREADKEAEKKIQADIKEARIAHPEPEIPADVAASGVKSPANEASGVVVNGPSIELPVSEEEYKQGLVEPVRGSVSNKVVYGPKSLIGLVLWIGRKIKMLHAKGKKIIFRK